ncbi:MAG TPA: signal peptidase I [Verrucomicrobiae bacterium]|jgi:signal peptidase I|nr:signal peptidase I [Verrucomicrobiae bacterium]
MRPSAPQQEKERTVPELRSKAKSVTAIIVIVLFAITFVVQASVVPSESMENTLLVGDYVLADKFEVGDGGPARWLFPYRDIRRGEIVVFHFPLDASQYLVKRVVGVPGDHIRMKDGITYVNGEALKEDYAIHSVGDRDFYRDNFPSQLWAAAMDVRWRTNLLRYVVHGDLVVPEGEYFVLGDNRDRSWDSRYWGFVPRANVVGRPLLVYLSVPESAGPSPDGPDDKLFHSGNLFSHLVQSARWKRMFILVR